MISALISTSKQGKILLLIEIIQTIVVVIMTLIVTIKKTVIVTMIRVTIYKNKLDMLINYKNKEYSSLC